VVDTKRNVSSRTALRNGRYDADGRVLGKKPSEAYLNALLQQGWQEQAEQRRLDSEIESLLDDEHELGLPDVGIESEESRGNRAMDMVLRVAQFWRARPQISVPTFNVGDEPENFANDLEEALNALIVAQEKAKRGPGGTFWDSVRKQVVGYGRGYGVLLPSPRAWKGYPDCDGDFHDPVKAREYSRKVESFAKGKLPPLLLESLPARRVIPFFDSDGLAECFWIKTERAYEVCERAEARGVTATRTLSWIAEKAEERMALPVTVIHYANRSYCAELVGSPRAFPPSELDNPDNWLEDCELIGEPYPHWIDRIPVAYFPGMTTPLSARHKQVVSVVYGARKLITQLDRLDSMKATAVRTWSWPTPVLKTSLAQAGIIEAGDDGRPRPIEIAPGMVVTLWGDEELSFLTYQGDGPESEQMVQRLEQQFQRVGLPTTESGSGDVSGYAYAQMRNASRGKFSSIQDGLQQGWTDLAHLEVEYLKQMPTTVYIPTVAEIGWAGGGVYADDRTKERSSYMRLKPEQLRDRSYVLDVTVEEDKSLDLIANAQAGQAMIAMGVPKRIVYTEVLGLKNYPKIRLLQMLEEAEQTDQYKSQVLGAALQQGRLWVEQQTQQAAAVTPDMFSQYDPQMLIGMAMQGLIPMAQVQQYLQQQQMNGVQGQLGAPGIAPGPAMAPGGPAGVVTGQGPTMPSPMMPQAGPMGAMGGAPSPAVTAAPAAPRPMPGRGRASGQSKMPGGPKRG
jgi:hypothetical protein